MLDTRGSLLQAYVMQRITNEQRQPPWNTETPPAAEELVRFLSTVACAARWSGSFNAIQLVPQSGHVQPATDHGGSEIVAEALLAWLDEHSAHSAFSLEQLPQTFDQQSVAHMLRFAQRAALLDINADGMLSFRHEMIAAYFCAEYFQALDSVGSTGSANNVNSKRSIPTSSVTQQFLSDVEQWSEVIALWAGLLDNPTELAENFIALGLLDGHTGPRQHRLSALAFSLICAGAAWRLPQAEATHFTQDMQLPTRVVDSMTTVVRNAPAREQLAQLFTLCAEEGGQEIYRSLLPLVMVEGIEEFLLLIDGTFVTDLLFTQLIETVEIFAYDAYVRRLCRVLGMLGSSVVDRASELSQRAPSRSLRLRAAAINILGSTHDASAVEPLIGRLSDSEPSVVERAIHALIRLGPALTLQAISAVLENTAGGKQAHRAALTILERFLSDKTTKNLAAIKPGTALVEPQAQSLNNVRILHTIIATLAAPYASEPATQQQSKAILIRLGQQDNIALSLEVAQPNAQLTSIPSVLIGLLTRYLSSNDDTMVRNAIQVLVQIGDDAVPTLLEQLNLQNSQLPEIVRVHMVEVLRTIYSPRALPTILRLLADSSLLVQQQVALALAAYQPGSITGLIDIVVAGDNDMVAEKAAHLLGDMGTSTVEPIMQSLSHLTPVVSSRLDARRIRLLVYILERIHDARAIAVLVRMLVAAQTAQPEPLLVVAVIHALGQFQDEQVVPPLIATLEHSHPQVYEEAIDALSHLGDLAFSPLIAALDVGQETIATPRIRRAILGMNPFPAERLITALQQSDRATHRMFQVQQILAILRAQGADAAQVMVNHLFDNDSRLRDYTRRALSEMDAAIVVPALLEALDHEAWCEGLAELLLNYPEAISPLVALLGDMDRCDAALAILPRYGVMVLPALISALDNANLVIQEQTQGIITTLVHQDVSVLSQVVRLFATALPLRAHEALLEVLTNELADVSIPALLDGLEDAQLIEDVSIALARLANKRSAQPEVIQGLLDALHYEERRRGAETALIKIGGLAVQPVGDLITDPDEEVAAAAQHVLGAIGVPALSFIWAAHGDISNRPRREAAMSVFQGMPTDVIKDALVQLLSSELPDDMSMALSLLVERIHDENTLSPENQEMVPTLLEYVQIYEGERISMRIAALLVLLGGASIVNHIIQILYNHSEEYMYSEQLLAILFFLRRESQNALAGLLNDPHAPTPLRAEAIALLGMMGRSKDVVDYAQSLSNYGLAAGRNNILYADQLTIALRALGSLLVSGNWDVTTLLDMRRNYREGTPQHELYSVLLGWRYEPELANLENTLQNERESHRRELMALTARIVSDQDQIADLENQLIQIREEHGQRNDELYQTTQEREAIRGRLDQTTREKHALQDQIAQLQSDNLQLVREIEAWRASQGR